MRRSGRVGQPTTDRGFFSAVICYGRPLYTDGGALSGERADITSAEGHLSVISRSRCLAINRTFAAVVVAARASDGRCHSMDELALDGYVNIVLLMVGYLEL